MLVVGVPWGLWALLGIPAVLALHWFRARHPPLRVTGLFLYPPPPARVSAGRRLERLRVVGSLLAELLAVVALTWWLADIHRPSVALAPHVVVVLDDRLRLQARSGGTTAAARLRTALDQRLAALPAGSRASLIITGDPPLLLAGPAATPDEARAALATWEPRAPWHDPAKALALAAQLGGSRLIASDRSEGWPNDDALVATGHALPTSGLATAAWHRRPTGDRLVIATFGRPGRPLEVRGDGIVLGRGESGPAPIILDLAAAPETVGIHLLGDDPLPDDDVAHLVRPPARMVQVRGDLPGLAEVAAAVGWIGREDPPDLVLDTGPVPAGAWSFVVAPGQAAPVVGPFLARAGHPLLQDLDASGLFWAGGDLTDGPGALLTAGEAVLLREDPLARRITLHADIPLSGLRRHPWWPGFLANLLESRRAAVPGVSEANPGVGQPAAATVLPGAVLEDPSGRRTTLVPDAEGRCLLVTAVPGTHLLRQPGRPPLRMEAQALDARLGDLAAAHTLTREAPVRTDTVDRRRSPAEHLLPLALAAAAALAAWACFRREA